ncbi:MAG: hypothetical protein A3C90_04060 [Candidatus Magasanikbacteria bacterium RIFCSPHIGHO2_02_FULL_51_14]|uniref:Uncharacterized protein n=1 Tax=Candidatus Magasanikbacteria bacterium RIFCSPHIGHO2_02_FULL_51_14 TaxID=1798683 RepID=A0A1F6MDL0_9BACT|nr:MAG: hypothetical protein A3C90_04060 [Candidatus Magasanikbacteria bacterium RIFCSPHIGHO2_02_FULL_51_14]
MNIATMRRERQDKKYVYGISAAIVALFTLVPFAASRACVCLITTGTGTNCEIITCDGAGIDACNAHRSESGVTEAQPTYVYNKCEDWTAAGSPGSAPAIGPETEAPQVPQAGTVPESVPLPNPLGEGVTSIPDIIGGVINTILGILGAITLFVFVDGAFNWITSAGSPERVKKGMKTMLFAVVGLFIIFASYGILNALFEALGTTGG